MGVVVLFLGIQPPFSLVLGGLEVALASYRGVDLGGIDFQFLPHLLIYGGIESCGLSDSERSVRARSSVR